MKAPADSFVSQWLPFLTAALSIVTLVTLFWAVDKHMFAQEMEAENSLQQQQLERQQQQQQRLEAQVQTLLEQKTELLERLERLRVRTAATTNPIEPIVPAQATTEQPE